MVKRTERKSYKVVDTKRHKSEFEKLVLECFFKLDKYFSRKTIGYILPLMTLSEEQLYKWGYERRKKHKSEKLKGDMDGTTGKWNENTSISFDSETDYNQVVDEMFPDIESMDSKLSPKQQLLYDETRRLLLKFKNSHERASSDKANAQPRKLRFSLFLVKDIVSKAKEKLNQQSKGNHKNISPEAQEINMALSSYEGEAKNE